MKQPVIFFVAGKSGGHILPGLTLAQEYKQQHNASIVFFSTDSRLDTKLINNHEAVDYYIPLALDNVPSNILHYPFFLYSVMKAFVKSLYYIRKFKPTSIISMGGYISIPLCMAAYCLRVPYKLFELNALPGKATKFLASSADTVYTCFSSAAHYLPRAHCVMHQYPLRFDTQKYAQTPQQARARIGFSNNKKTLFIVGGSQGSLFINTLMQDLITHHAHLRSCLQIIHQTGALDTTDWQAFYKSYNIPAIVFAYQDALHDYYNAADLILCRSGAGTLYEILFFGKQCITIPLETKSTDHQIDNARCMAKEYPQMFTVLLQKDVQPSSHLFAEKIQQHLAL